VHNGTDSASGAMLHAAARIDDTPKVSPECCARSRRMPITPYLQLKVFEPETTRAMGVAFEKACRTLGLSPTPDAMTESVAKVIIALAEGGETDAERLYEKVLAHFSPTG
jgi:hypothetical protein